MNVLLFLECFLRLLFSFSTLLKEKEKASGGCFSCTGNERQGIIHSFVSHYYSLIIL